MVLLSYYYNAMDCHACVLQNIIKDYKIHIFHVNNYSSFFTYDMLIFLEMYISCEKMWHVKNWNEI